MITTEGDEQDQEEDGKAQKIVSPGKRQLPLESE
jgi:hypothetical protein